MKIDLKKIVRGTVLTVKDTHNNDNIFITVFYADMKKGQIEIYDEQVHHFYKDGTYAGACHFKDPYTFSIEEFDKKVSFTDEKTIQKIITAFNKNNSITNFPSQEENDEKYKKLEEQRNEEKRKIEGMKEIERLEKEDWKVEKEEIRNHALAMTLLNNHGGICQQPTIEKTPKKGWGPEFDPDNPFSYKEEF